jgi:hypothetical protein
VGSGQGDNDPFREPTRGQVFEPVGGELGEEVRVRLDGSQPGEIQGSTLGTGLENLPLVPYRARYAEYQRTALESLDRMTVPADLQALVRDYFTLLEP